MSRGAVRTRAETSDFVFFSPHALSSLVSCFPSHRPQFGKNWLPLLDHFDFSKWKHGQTWCREESVKIQNEGINFCSTLCGGNQSERRWEIKLSWGDITKYEILGVVRRIIVITKANQYLYCICLTQKSFWRQNIDDSFIIKIISHNGQIKS